MTLIRFPRNLVKLIRDLMQFNYLTALVDKINSPQNIMQSRQRHRFSGKALSETRLGLGLCVFAAGISIVLFHDVMFTIHNCLNIKLEQFISLSRKVFFLASCIVYGKRQLHDLVQHYS